MCFRSACAVLLALLCVVSPLAAQSSPTTACPDFGGFATPARWDDAPFSLQCGVAAPPVWRLYTPPHRAPGAKPGHAPRDATALPRLLVAYRCTGLWWLPFVPDQLRRMGYVVDQPDAPCTPFTP